MAGPAPVPTAELGPEGQACPQCAEPLRSDQRYCLNCGRRRAQTRLAFLDVVGPEGPERIVRTAVAPAPAGAVPERSPLVALIALVALLLALGIGVVIGRGAQDPAPVARAPIVNVRPAAGATGGATVAVPVTGDWPAGTTGWTVSLRTLPDTATPAEVTQAKQEATTAGASAVGVVRSDEYPSLPAGRFVIYSGVFTSKAQATTASAGLRKDFPEAAVLRVATTARPTSRKGSAPAPAPAPKAKTPSTLSPQEFQKRSKKLPDEVQSDGEAPPVDGGAPGGGSGEATEIG